MDAFVEAFPMIRRLLAACTPARARYVDMPRLWERLDATRFRAKPQPQTHHECTEATRLLSATPLPGFRYRRGRGGGSDQGADCIRGYVYGRNNSPL